MKNKKPKAKNTNKPKSTHLLSIPTLGSTTKDSYQHCITAIASIIIHTTIVIPTFREKNTENMNAAAGVPPSTLLDKAATDLSSSTPTQTTSLQALWISFAIIFVSEIGDKTFMIGAVMAMRHARSTIFAASAAALGLMTVLSALLGFALPNLISRRVTQFLAGGLFFVFGIKCLMEASSMTGKEGQEELDEVVKEIGEKEAHLKAEMVEVGSGMSKSSSSDGLLLGKGAASPDSKKKAAFPGSSDSSSLVDGWKNLMYLLFSPVFIQTFVMVFLAEWGDRSQIASKCWAYFHRCYLMNKD